MKLINSCVMYFAVLILLLGVTTGYTRRNSQGGDRSDLSQEKEIVRTRYEEVRKTLGVTGKTSKARIRTMKGRDVRGNLIAIEDDSMVLEIVEKTGETALVMSLAAFEEQANWRRQFPQIKKPTKRAMDMVELSGSFVKRITGKELPGNFVAEAEYFDHGSHRGEWHILWRRTLNGYPYASDYSDYVGTFFADDSGRFEGLSTHPQSETCPTEVKLSKQDAEKIALEVANRYVDKIYEGGESSNPKIKSNELRIVNPNKIFERMDKNLEEEVTTKSRLAYCVWVRYTSKWVAEILVWVDAATGEILGGSFNL